MNGTIRRETPLSDFGTPKGRQDQAVSTGGLGSALPATDREHAVPLQYKAYFASALTNLPDDLYRQLQDIRRVADEVCEGNGIDLYVPMDHTDPTRHRDIPATEVYTKDRRSVAEADLVLLVSVAPSYGAGQELEIARAALIPVIALVPKGQRLSRMVHGSPTFKRIIEFDGVADIEQKLHREIREIYPWFDEARKARALLNQEVVGARIKARRLALGLTIQDLADRAGVTPEEVQVLEEERVEFSNPSIIQLAKISQSLETPLENLLNPNPAAPYLQHAITSLGPIEAYVAGARNRRNLPDKDRAIIRSRLIESIRSRYTRDGA